MQISQVTMSYGQTNFDQIWWEKVFHQFLCAPQYKLKRFVTMTTYWVPDFSNIMGFSGHLWHSILIFANKALYGGRRGSLMVSVHDSGVSGPGSSPGWGHGVVFLGKTLYSHSTSLHPGV